MTQQALPYQLTEESFRKYEPFIKQAVKNAPLETSFSVPDGLSVNTFVARVRDAIVSLKRFRWDTTIDVEKLWTLSGKYIWSIDPGGEKIWFREKQKRGRPLEYAAEAHTRQAAQAGASISSVWTNLQVGEIDSLALLIHNQRITGPVYVEGQLPEELTSRLSSLFDVAFTFDTTKNQTIIT